MVPAGFEPLDPVSPNPGGFGVLGGCSCNCVCTCTCGGLEESMSLVSGDTNWLGTSSNQTVNIAQGTLAPGCLPDLE